MPEEKEIKTPPDENELHVHYVNVEQEKEASIIMPLISLVLAIGTFLFYPLQIIAIILSIISIYLTRNHAITYKPMIAVALVLALLGFFIGMGDVDIYASMIPVFEEMKTGISCDDLEINLIEDACYDAQADMITARIRPSRDMYKANLEIVTENKTYSSKINDPVLQEESARIRLPFDSGTKGEPNELKIIPIIRSYITKDIFVCQNATISASVGVCS